MECGDEVRILSLNFGEHKDSTLYRLQKGWLLHFKLGPTLASKSVTICCDHPSTETEIFCRSSFHHLEWHNNTANNGDRSDAYAEVKICMAGSFQYYFTVEGQKCGGGYFVVDPTLRVGTDDHILPMDSICMHTVLPKSLGRFSDWMGRLRVSFKSGYNVLHLTPVQKLGCSNSAYSIAEQLEFNPTFSKGELVTIGWKDVKDFVSALKSEWRMLTMTDVVWNHTAKNSEWLQTNPECGFNLANSPYLRPAYILDRALFYFTLDVGAGKYMKAGIPKQITTEKHLCLIEKVLLNEVIPTLRLWEFTQVDVDKTVAAFTVAARKYSPPEGNQKQTRVISILQDCEFRRNNSLINIEIALNQFYSRPKKVSLKLASENLRKTLLWLNKSKKEDVEADMRHAVKNVIATIRYERLDEKGPRKILVSKSEPLMTEYFYHPFPDISVEEDEKLYVNDPKNGQFIMALNGWVMGSDPMKNFAEYPTSTYLRRELICWGDSVKLNYGASPEDCPVLWERMKKYTMLTAEIFHGIRIDNCHSTPIHVAEFMLDAARQVRPDLYVFAELFTGSEAVDNVFVNRLGINSLIREGLIAWDSKELGRLVFRYGGEPVASFFQLKSRPLMPCMAHALLYDVTHDNESVIEKRTVFDSLPFSALVSMANCAVGSSRGHDELVPHHIHVVNEKRLYASWHDNAPTTSKALIGHKTGILEGKRILNHLHQTMAMNGFNQVYVDQRDVDVVAVTRHNPATHQSYVLIAHTAFANVKPRHVAPLVIEGHLEGIAFEAKPIAADAGQMQDTFVQDTENINGLTDFSIAFESDLPLSLSNCCKVENDPENNRAQKITFTDFPPGSVIVFRVKLVESADRNAQNLRQIISDIQSGSDNLFSSILASMDLCTLNRVLFRCDAEEKSDWSEVGVYDFMGWDSLKYCGIQGIMSVMAKIRTNNDLGHPVCNNMREGNWLMEYIVSRLQKHKHTKRLGDWYMSAFKPLFRLPRYLIPSYFDMLMATTYAKFLDTCWSQMPPLIAEGTTFAKFLALGSVALCGIVKESGLPMTEEDEELPSLAAGLPHFATGIMRCWGRDTFIALRGLILLPGRYTEAKKMIMGFASCVRHGLIPNLLGEGKICRYNCRDAFWWWLQCVQDYCESCTNGYDLLDESIGRIFPSDDSPPIIPTRSRQPLYDVIQHCLQCHVHGINFRELGAGPGIDSNMSDEGFNVEAGVDLRNGFVYGGNEFNCGTWMDKMGESEKAGSKGVPATPRDGSAVELVGLCKSAVRWLQKANNNAKYPYDGVFLSEEGQTIKLSWQEWSKRILENFEKNFFIYDDDRSQYVHKRGIYKDTVGSSHPWCDYQLRPNFPIAMVIAPELFHVDNAWRALNIVENKLLGRLGMKTLDPDDMMYRPDYDNSNDSDDRTVAKGFNYHQGPEWLWPVGFFLRAKLHFAKELGDETLKNTVNFVRGYLSSHQIHIENSMWKGLPELTNSGGKWCRDSCEIQAWSNATILEVLYDLGQYGV